MSRKRALSEENEGATSLKSLSTPINLFEDECVFCHSFRTSLFHGPMVRYLKGRVVSIDEGNSSDAIYVIGNASSVWFKGDIVMNFEPEIRRALKLTCRRCGLKGAALGCYYDPCLTSFHVPCAVQTIGCRWDVDGYVLCPEHVSNALPCDNLGTQTKENYNASSLDQSRRADKEGNFDYHNRENQQTDQLKHQMLPRLTQRYVNSIIVHEDGISTNCSRAGEQTDQLNSSSYIEKEDCFDSHRRKDQQTDHLNISSPYLPHKLHSHQKEEISTNSSMTSK
ncbi:hypothetical protein BDA96_04G214200 [Sorghum bicolor]|uniref:PHD-type domain-containing protein n=1 Tax=Sorghum bicolor TaxID=4558 RepID=A0A921UIT5_SORBI|nr:hypothetical protein BDA96_04G214200 [Sorghum bicolor]